MLSSDVCEAAALGRVIWSHGANRFVPGKFGASILISGESGRMAGWVGTQAIFTTLQTSSQETGSPAQTCPPLWTVTR